MAGSAALHPVAESAGLYCTSARSDGREAAVAAAAAAAATPAAWQPDPEMDLVLSDVHIGRAPSATQRCTTVFRFRPGWAPPGCDAEASANLSCSGPDRAGCHSSCYSRDSSQPAAAVPRSGAAPAHLDEDGDVVVKRRRRSADGATTGAAEGGPGGGMAGGIVMHHAMATSLHNVGKQVSMLVDERIQASLCRAGPAVSRSLLHSCCSGLHVH
jgi:hypothetical protein